MELSSKDMHVWRIAGAIGWSIVFQFIFHYCYIFIANLNFWHPLYVFSVSFSSIFSLNTLLNIVPLALVIFCQGLLCSRDYINQRNNQVSNTRFSLLLNFFTIHNFTTLVLFSVVGITLGCVHTSVLNKRLNSFSTLCPNQIEICLNEERFFLVCDGFWMGMYSFMRNYVFRSSKALVFPPIQQDKFIRIKSSFLPCVKNSFARSIVPSFLFFICYFFKGDYLRSTFSSILYLETKNDGLDSVFTLVDFELMFYLWMLSTTFIVTLEMMEILFNIYLTEKAVFPVSALLALPADNVSLQDALMCESIPIIQHLGFYDLAVLAEFDDERRAQLFTLSQPGGHARTWNSVSGQCFKVINTFLDELDKAFDESRLTSSEINTNKKHDLSAPKFPTQEHVYSPRIRCLSPVVVQSHPVSTSTIQKSYEQVLKNCSSWFDEKLNAFYKKPLIVYLFGDMIEPKVKQLLIDRGQPVTWAVKSLSLLACSSLREDYFGVVQKDLGIIILTLVHLKQSLEKLQKQNMYNRKIQKAERIDLQVKNALRWTIKQSLYRIAIVFGSHVKDIDLPGDVQQQMMNFVSFKEV